MASEQAKEYETKIFAGKEKQKQSHEERLEESMKRLLAQQKDFDPQLIKNPETELSGTLSEIESIQNEMDNTRVLDLDSVEGVTEDLTGAKESLSKVAEEESSLSNLVESLKLELENTKRVHAALKEKEAETESLAGYLHVKLRKAKTELEEALAEEPKLKAHPMK